MGTVKAVILLCTGYAMLNVTGSALIKSELAKFSLVRLIDWGVFLFRIKVLTGLCLNFLSILMIFKALDLGKFTYVLPVSVGINFFLSVIIGYFVFDDSLTIISFIGMGSIFLGIALMSIAV